MHSLRMNAAWLEDKNYDGNFQVPKTLTVKLMPSAKYLFFWNIYGTKNSVIITSFLHLTLILNRLGLVTKGHRSQKMLISHIRLRSYETGLLSFTYFRLFTRRLQAGILILVVVIFMFFFFFKESVCEKTMDSGEQAFVQCTFPLASPDKHWRKINDCMIY